MDGLQSIFPRLAVNILGELAPHLLIPVKGIPWSERPVDNAMLRDSMKVVASGDIPTHTGTYIEAYVDDDVYSSIILEPTKDILSWMDMHIDIKEYIRTLCPEYLRAQPLKVLFYCTPPEKEDKYTMWLRNSLLVHYPDNMYLVHLMDSIDVPGDFSQSFSDFTDNRLSWSRSSMETVMEKIQPRPLVSSSTKATTLTTPCTSCTLRWARSWFTSSERRVRKTLTVSPKQSLTRIWVSLCMLVHSHSSGR